MTRTLTRCPRAPPLCAASAFWESWILAGKITSPLYMYCVVVFCFCINSEKILCTLRLPNLSRSGSKTAFETHRLTHVPPSHSANVSVLFHENFFEWIRCATKRLPAGACVGLQGACTHPRALGPPPRLSRDPCRSTTYCPR